MLLVENVDSIEVVRVWLDWVEDRKTAEEHTCFIGPATVHCADLMSS